MPNFAYFLEDYHLQYYLRKLIDKQPYEYRRLLKGVRWCGKKTMKNQFGEEPGVFLLKNDIDHPESIFWGVQTCKSSTVCPVCSARTMNRHAAQIAALLEGLKKQGYSACMITLTMLHTRHMDFYKNVQTLYEAWKEFNSVSRKAKKIKTVAKFYKTFNINYKVRVCETTYSLETGWNPHFHCLFWVKTKDLQKIADWEFILQERWESAVIRAWSKLCAQEITSKPNSTEKFDDVYKSYQKYYKKMYVIGKKRNRKAQSLFISKTKDGKIIEQKTSSYLSGWGADRELTGKPRKQASGQYSSTPYEILRQASEGGREAEKLFTEYMIGIRLKKRTRIMYSRAAYKLIKQFMRQEYLEIAKKNFQEFRNWKCLLWLSREQWEKIQTLDDKYYITSNLLYMAAYLNYDTARKTCSDYLRICFGINAHIPETNIYTELAEKIFNVPKYAA